MYLERLSQAYVEGEWRFERARHELLAIHLEPHVDSNRADWRSVAHAEADGAAQLAQIEVGRSPEDVAGIEEPDEPEAAEHRSPQLAVEDDYRVAADREAVAID